MTKRKHLRVRDIKAGVTAYTENGAVLLIKKCKKTYNHDCGFTHLALKILRAGALDPAAYNIFVAHPISVPNRAVTRHDNENRRVGLYKK